MNQHAPETIHNIQMRKEDQSLTFILHHSSLRHTQPTSTKRDKASEARNRLGRLGRRGETSRLNDYNEACIEVSSKDMWSEVYREHEKFEYEE